MSGIIAQNSARNTGLIKASSGGGGTWNLILTQTASNSSTVSFTSGIDSTYSKYVFKFTNIHADGDIGLFKFQGSIDGGSNYNVSITSTYVDAEHREDDSDATLNYLGTSDLHNGTGFQPLCENIGSGADESLNGTLTLYNPSSTTFQKQWVYSSNFYYYSSAANNAYATGYFNDTNDVDAIQFKMSFWNAGAGSDDPTTFDGQISLYGIT